MQTHEPREILVWDRLLIKLYDENVYEIQSAENIYNYKTIYLNGEYLSSKVGIRTFEGDDLIADCLIGAEGGATRVHMGDTLIRNGGLVICCADSVFKLSIPDLKLEWVTKADIGTCFEIAYLGADYVVHGELEITRLDKDGKIVWQRGGRDIFTTVDGTDTFEVTDDFIIVKDFQNYTYKFDYNGNIVD